MLHKQDNSIVNVRIFPLSWTALWGAWCRAMGLMSMDIHTCGRYAWAWNMVAWVYYHGPFLQKNNTNLKAHETSILRICQPLYNTNFLQFNIVIVMGLNHQSIRETNDLFFLSFQSSVTQFSITMHTISLILWLNQTNLQCVEL